MKKSIMLFVAAILCATVSYSQTTGTGAGETTKPSTQSPNSQAPSKTHQGNSEKSSAAQTSTTEKVDTRSKQAQQNTAGDGSTRPGGASNDNANDVGRYSDKDAAANEKSMLNSKKAVEARRKNLTEADTTMKKGSGSAAKNTKNHTGKTGNYQNQEIKHNQGTPTRP